MAEGENNSEKKVVEMNIWFAILLVVIVITAAWIITLNTKLGAANAENATLKQDVARLSSESSNRATLIRDIQIMAVDGSISQKLVLEKLEAAGYNSVDEVPAKQNEVVVSGEVISGELAE